MITAEPFIRTEEEAKKILLPIVPRLHTDVSSALEKYRSPDNSKLCSQFSKRSKASTVNDLIWSELENDFGKEFRFTEVRNRRLMHVGAFNIRVKKFNSSMMPLNIRTQAVLGFLGQESFAGMEPATNIDLGYKYSDIAEVEFVLYFRCPKSTTGYNWLWLLDKPIQKAEPTTTIPPKEPVKRVKLKEPITPLRKEQRNVNN